MLARARNDDAAPHRDASLTEKSDPATQTYA